MTRQFHRALKITLGDGGITIDEQLRTRFKITHTVYQMPNVLEVRITNLSDQTANQIMKEYKKIELAAGYKDNIGVLFKGTIKFFRNGRENPTDTYLDLFAATREKAYNFAVVNKTLPANSTPKDMVDTAVAAMKKIEDDIKLKFVGPDLSKPKFPRSIPLYGMARNVLREIALLKDATWFNYNGDINILEKTATLQGGPVILNAKTGLIGRAAQTVDGIEARCLINPQIHPGGVVKIDQKSIDMSIPTLEEFEMDAFEAGTISKARRPSIAADGKYKVLKMDIIGDTRGTPWYMDLICINASDTTLPPDASTIPYLQQFGSSG